MNEVTEEQAGCWVAGHWGQYAVAHMVLTVEDLLPPEDFSEAIDLAKRHLDAMQPSDSEGLTDIEYWSLIEISDEIETWLNENVAPEGYLFGWHDGEFFLWPIEEWEEI